MAEETDPRFRLVILKAMIPAILVQGLKELAISQRVSMDIMLSRMLQKTMNPEGETINEAMAYGIPQPKEGV